jgi:pimeloyl-ACP methyl ester carboxylesterase
MSAEREFAHARLDRAEDGGSKYGIGLQHLLWFALVTAIPGLVTMAVVYGAVVIARPEMEVPAAFEEGGAWLWTAVVVTVMVLTQAFGILLEEKILIPGQRLGGAERERKVGRAIDPLGTEEHFTINAYEEYLGMWVLLAHLDENDDSQGHLKRAAAQFFNARRPAAPPPEPLTCEQLGAITTPTLLVGAGYGMRYSRRIIDILAGCITGSCSIVIPSVTHFMSYQEPEVFNEAVLGFFSHH